MNAKISKIDLFSISFAVFICAFSLASIRAFAQDSAAPAPLAFQAWKDQQVLEAQNQVLRASARITSLKSNRPSGSKVKDLTNGKFKKVSDTDTLAAAEQDLKHSKDSLEAANNLKFDDYVDVYVPTLQDQPEALQKLAEKMSKEELASMLKSLMRQSSLANAKRNAALVEGLSLSDHGKIQ